MISKGQDIPLLLHVSFRNHWLFYTITKFEYVNPKATDRGPFGPRKRLTTDFLRIFEDHAYEFVTKMVLHD